jgi:kynurenine formamidase
VEDIMAHRRKLWLVVVILVAGLFAIFLERAPGQNKTSATVTPADYLKWRNEFKNWGRWGADDQRGVSNLITAEKSLSAVRLVKNGIVISLAHAVPQKVDPEVPAGSVFHRSTENIGAFNTIDKYEVSYHGLATAHMDAFCHFFLEGKMYNGYSVADNITPQTGCKKDDVMAWRDGVVTRAVLYDIPQLKGVDWIEPGTPITRGDLEAWEKKSGVKAGPGDVIMLYVGRWKRRAAKGPYPNAIPGYFADVIPFIKEREVAFVGHDFNIDWAPRPGWGEAQGIPVNPIHQAVLNWMGVGIVENLDLERAVETARRLKRYEFMLTFAPLPVEGGTGSPLNPLAVF